MKGRVWRGDPAFVIMFVLLIAAGSLGRAQDIQKPLSSGPAQDVDGPGIRDLAAAENIPFATPPPSALLSETKCDSKGNIYLVQTGVPPALLSSGGLSSVPVSKLSIGSKSVVAFPVPSLDRYRGVIRSDFDVSSEGNLYSLLQAVDAISNDNNAVASYFVSKHHDDGTLDSYFRLGTAPGIRIQPFRFATFRNGSLLITGTAVKEGEPLRPFIAVFDRDGRFVRDVKVSEANSSKTTTNHGTLSRGEGSATETSKGDEDMESESDRAVALSSSSLMISAPDGNVYLLRGSTQVRLYVISPAGEVIRQFDVSRLAPGLTPTNMAMAGNESIFISFGRVQGISADTSNPDGPNDLIGVINPQTGEAGAVYRLPADALGVPACATSSDTFLFVGTTADQQHQQVAKYSQK